MSSDWVEIDLKNVCSLIKRGISPKYTDSAGMIVVNQRCIRNQCVSLAEARYHDIQTRSIPLDKYLQIGDVLINSTGVGTLGRVATIKRNLEPITADSHVTILRADQKIVDKDYFGWFLRSRESSIETLGEGSTGQTELSRASLYNIKIKIPPRNEQISISNILNSLDDRLENINKINVTLESIAQALFKSWFVDFDPVRAKAEGRAPEGIDAETAALFPDNFEESELGLVPKGWRVQAMGDVVQVLGGGTPSTKESIYWHPETHHWATPKDLSGISAPVLLKTDRKISDQGLAKISSGLLPINTLLLSSRAPIGYLAIAKIPTAINQGFIAIPPHIEMSAPFLLIWCRQNMELIKQKANGSTFMEINKSTFRSIRIVCPTIDVSNSFTRVINLLFDKITENEYQAQTLVTLRDTLLPRLISGQLRLPEAEEIIGTHL